MRKFLCSTLSNDTYTDISFANQVSYQAGISFYCRLFIIQAITLLTDDSGDDSDSDTSSTMSDASAESNSNSKGKKPKGNANTVVITVACFAPMEASVAKVCILNTQTLNMSFNNTFRPWNMFKKLSVALL